MSSPCAQELVISPAVYLNTACYHVNSLHYAGPQLGPPSVLAEEAQRATAFQSAPQMSEQDWWHQEIASNGATKKVNDQPMEFYGQDMCMHKYIISNYTV